VDGSFIQLNLNRPNNPIFDNTWQQLAQLQGMGVKVHMMLGCSPCDPVFGSLFSHWDQFYPMLQQTLKQYHFDGINLDVEESVALSDIQHLIDQLSADFGSGFAITFDPVGSDLTQTPSQGLSGFDYKALYQSPVGSKIAWFDTQFYNGWGNISTPSDYETAVNNGFPPSKVVADMLCNGLDGPQGYVDINQVANDTIKVLSSKYADFAGASCWEYFNAMPGGEANPWQWSQIMVKAIGRTTSSNILTKVLAALNYCELAWGTRGRTQLDTSQIAGLNPGIAATLQDKYTLECMNNYRSCELVSGNGNVNLNLANIHIASASWIYDQLAGHFNLNCTM
jgi:hypothetical protein